MSSLAPYASTPDEVIAEMLRLAGLKAGESLYDLGSGDGRILITAARDFAAYAVGVELNENMVTLSLNKVRELGLQDKVKVIHGDIMNVNLADADVITIYLTARGNETLRPKLEEELKHHTRVISHNFLIQGWKPEHIAQIGWRTIYLYKHSKS